MTVGINDSRTTVQGGFLGSLDLGQAKLLRGILEYAKDHDPEPDGPFILDENQKELLNQHIQFLDSEIEEATTYKAF